MRLTQTNLTDGTFDYVDPGELSELFLDHILEYTDALSLYAQAVELGGTLEITGTDFNSVIDKYTRRILRLDQINNLLSGDRKFLITLESVLKDLSTMGFQVMNKRIDSETNDFYIKAVRTQ